MNGGAFARWVRGVGLGGGRVRRTSSKSSRGSLLSDRKVAVVRCCGSLCRCKRSRSSRSRCMAGLRGLPMGREGDEGADVANCDHIAPPGYPCPTTY